MSNKMKKALMKTRIVLFIVLGIAFNIQAKGQSSCDNLYAKAIQYQQTMTIASQNQAISYFQKALTCYDSEDKKNLCTSQITTCKNTISIIKKNNQNSLESKKKKVENDDNLTIVGQSGIVQEDTVKVVLSVDESIVKFKAKGGEFKKVKVTCNYDDWKVTEYPDWITYSINNDKEIVLEASENPSKEERSYIIKVECRGESVTFAVLQLKKGLLNNIGL